MPEFRIGDVIEIVNEEDAPDEICRATVTRFMSDEEQGMAKTTSPAGSKSR